LLEQVDDAFDVLLATEECGRRSRQAGRRTDGAWWREVRLQTVDGDLEQVLGLRNVLQMMGSEIAQRHAIG
jgi:hypothetical protein